MIQPVTPAPTPALTDTQTAGALPADAPVVLLTGAHGFTGVWVRRELEAAGYRVCGAVSGAPADGEVAFDLRDRAAVAQAIATLRPDYIVHLAAISFVGHAEPADFYRVNVLGTEHLLQGCVAANHVPRKILISSSANIYGSVPVAHIEEDQPPAPVNHYAISKLAMEHMLRMWFDRLPIVVTRPFNYTGVGQRADFLVPKIVSHFAAKKPAIELGNLDVARDFSDVRMVARAYRLLLESDARGGTYNICSENLVSLRDIVAMLEKLAGYQIDVQVNPAFVRPNDIAKLGGSSARLREAVGELPVLPLSDTLAWMYHEAANDKAATSA